MYNNVKYWTVTESNILSNDTVGTAIYVFMDKGAAEQKLYRLWGYAANPEASETKQCFSIWMTEHNKDRNIMLESKVFDYRQPEPIPEHESESDLVEE